MVSGIRYESDFPHAEYIARNDRIQSKMQELGVDALLLSRGIHLRYATGYRTPFWGDAQLVLLALIPGDPSMEPVLILSRFAEFSAGTTWIQDIEYTGPDRAAPFNDPCDLAVEIVKSRGLAQSVIGLDINNAVTDNMPVTSFDRVRNGLPHAQFVDAADVLSPVRQVKSPAEIDAIKSACHTTCSAWEAALNSLAEGQSEKELAAILGSTILETGPEAGLFRPWILYMASGRDLTGWCNLVPSQYRFQKGDMVLVDGGSTCLGYHADMIRWGSIGELSSRNGTLLDTAIQANMACKSVIRAGATCAQIHQAGAEVYRNSDIDLDDWQVWSPAGHGVGLEVHEAPFLAPDNHAPLHPGMVITVEPLLVRTRGGRFANNPAHLYRGEAPDMMVVEDMVVVTETGYELLTPLQPYLWVS